MVMNQL